MNIFARRRPLFRSLLIIGSIFLAVWCYALATDTMIAPGSRTQRGRVVKKNENPREYQFFMRYFGSVAIVCVFVSFVRINPVEDRLKAWKKTTKAKIEVSDAATKPAPLWAYAFLAAFVAFIAYLGYIFMYKE
jgi:hypothetical protein